MALKVIASKQQAVLTTTFSQVKHVKLTLHCFIDVAKHTKNTTTHNKKQLFRFYEHIWNREQLMSQVASFE